MVWIMPTLNRNIGGEVAQAHRNNEETGGLRREVVSVRIGAAHDGGDRPDRRVLAEAVLVNERVEAAAVPDVGHLDSGHIVGNGARLLGGPDHI
jgi:hypothetical protein